MSNVYNIYKVKAAKLDILIKKIRSIELHEQKTINSSGYEMTFYFSSEANNQGSTIWWWETYRDFFNDGIDEPINISYFGLLLCKKIDSPEQIYAVSLGKTHFYLSKFIERDFGIKIAVRMVNEENVLLKKSRYFAGTKRQEISSYISFVKNNYEAGESVEHLKSKAQDTGCWGEKNIIFADSIQIDISESPQELVKYFELIESTLLNDEVIDLPKLELVKDEDTINRLDNALSESIRQNDSNLTVDEIQVMGVNFCFRFVEYEYEIYTKGDYGSRESLGNTIDIQHVCDFVVNNNADINDINIKFSIEGSKPFTKELKELLDIHLRADDIDYCLRDGEWYLFNQKFLEYLKSSLESIEHEKSTILLSENEYQTWRNEKQSSIESGLVDSKVLYREYYFNHKLSDEDGYSVLDRELEQIQSVQSGRKKYKVEIADLYKDDEIIAVKISTGPSSKASMIYNIQQSLTALDLIKSNDIDFAGKESLKTVSLWFVYYDDMDKITEINSIQFLLAIEAWKKRVQHYGLTPKIYISKYEKNN